VVGRANPDTLKDTARDSWVYYFEERLSQLMRRVLLFVVGPLALRPTHPIFVLYLAYFLTANLRGIAQ
jgi:hypothetical protein